MEYRNNSQNDTLKTDCFPDEKTKLCEASFCKDIFLFRKESRIEEYEL